MVLSPNVRIHGSKQAPCILDFKKRGYVDEGILVDESFKNDRYYDVIMMARFEK